MEKLKIGIIGLGKIAQIFHLPILKKNSDVEIIAACDSDKPKSKYVADKFGIKNIYTAYDEMFSREDLQSVVICTPTDSHKEIAIASLDAGLDVFVEKPIARTLDEASSILAAVEKNKKKLMVGMNSRFRPDMMILKSIIEAGELGNIFYAKAGWIKKLPSTNPWITRKEKAGGGVFIDLGISALDTLLWTLKFAPIRRVNGITYNHTTKNVEDTCIAFFETNDGASLSLEVSWSFQSDADSYYCDIFGTKGSARINPLRIYKTMGGNVVNVTPVKSDTQHNIMKKSYENEIKHFVGAARGLFPVISTAAEAVRRMEIVEAVYKSAKKKKEVILK